MRGRGSNIKRQIMFNRCEGAIQDTSSDTGFIWDSNSEPQLGCLVDFTQAQSPNVKVIGTNLISFVSA